MLFSELGNQPEGRNNIQIRIDAQSLCRPAGCLRLLHGGRRLTPPAGDISPCGLWPSFFPTSLWDHYSIEANNAGLELANKPWRCRCPFRDDNLVQHSEPVWLLPTDAGWVDTFTKVGEGEGSTFMADRPPKRIDYIMAAGPIGERVSEARPLFEGAFRLNINDDESFALSDHLPQLAAFDIGK